MKQTTLGSTDWALKSKVTRRGQVLNEMEAVVPWPRLLAVIEPHYPKAEEERPPHRCRGCCGSTSSSNGSICRTRRWRMLCTTAKRCVAFAGIDLTAELVPDETCRWSDPTPRPPSPDRQTSGAACCSPTA